MHSHIPRKNLKDVRSVLSSWGIIVNYRVVLIRLRELQKGGARIVKVAVEMQRACSELKPCRGQT